MIKKAPPIIALITDFGSKDWYAGSIKGKICSFCPEAKIVDITHSIPPGDISSASYVLASSLNDFPPQTIFLVVVDPGVGTKCKAIMGRIGKHTVVCPNNGVISHACNNHPHDKGPFYEILPENGNQDSINSTIQGRDVFAPLVGVIAAGAMKIEDLGEIVHKLELLKLPQPEIHRGVINGVISYIDYFGNAITNISQTELGLFSVKSSAFVMIKDKKILLRTSFGEVEIGQPLTYIGCNGYLEIGMNQRKASKLMKISIGDEIQFYPETIVESNSPTANTSSD